MAAHQKRLLFLLFFFSGFCGLLYQVVWSRMAFASFGVITPVLSVVISVFMLGLFAGSWAAGRSVEKITRLLGISAIWLYAVVELLIGFSAFAVPAILKWGEIALLPLGGTDSAAYLGWSAVILGGAILPWCCLMGTTIPLVMAFVKERSAEETTGFSFLYLANVIGAMAGTLFTAVVLVEAFGFQGTLLIAATLNLFISLASARLGLGHPRRATVAAPVAPAAPIVTGTSRSTAFVMAALFLTGFTSMAMEVVWTRAFTTVLMTQVYSFAALLFVYLLATWVGSWMYRRHLVADTVWSDGRLLATLCIAVCLPLVLNDPRLKLKAAAALLSVFPLCGLLGYLTPKFIDEYSRGNPERAGTSYAVNVLGCIVGPLAASYLFLPAMGVKWSLVVLAAPYFVLYFIATGPRPWVIYRKQTLWAGGLLLVAVLFAQTYEERVEGFRGRNGQVRRDHTATVISYGEGMGKRLLVNGVGITHMTTITKIMGHLPLALLPRKPESALVICFGMGTTFRSLASWDIRATAVELVPSVKDAFAFYFDDATEVMSRPGVKVVIDDGRRFLRRATETFDVITLDPPPPVEAAASSLLYSEEFYDAVKARLNESGILQQWIPDAEPKIVAAVVRSLVNQFPHVRIFQSHEGWGHHFLASMSPIELPPANVLAARLPEKAKGDLVEWMEGDRDTANLFAKILAGEKKTEALMDGTAARVTDDRPYNEYFLIRRTANLLTGPGRG